MRQGSNAVRVHGHRQRVCCPLPCPAAYPCNSNHPCLFDISTVCIFHTFAPAPPCRQVSKIVDASVLSNFHLTCMVATPCSNHYLACRVRFRHHFQVRAPAPQFVHTRSQSMPDTRHPKHMRCLAPCAVHRCIPGDWEGPLQAAMRGDGLMGTSPPLGDQLWGCSGWVEKGMQRCPLLSAPLAALSPRPLVRTDAR